MLITTAGVFRLRRGAPAVRSAPAPEGDWSALVAQDPGGAGAVTEDPARRGLRYRRAVRTEG